MESWKSGFFLDRALRFQAAVQETVETIRKSCLYSAQRGFTDRCQ